MSPDADFEVRQEDDRVSSRTIVAVFGAAIVVTLLSIGVQWLMLRSRRSELDRPRPAAARVAPRQIAAIHQTLIEKDRHGLELRDEQRAALEGWSWVDRDRGVARIPIERAMDMLVAEPWLTHATASPSASTSTGTP